MVIRKSMNCRGRVVEIILEFPVVLNGNEITKVKVEIDHINFGLNKKTGMLNRKRRTNFLVRDIKEFIRLLNGEDIVADDYKGRVSKFSIRINCPIYGRFYDREFIMIFDTHYDKINEIYVITLFPSW